MTIVLRQLPETAMHFETFSFGSIRIDGVTYESDIVIDRGTIRHRKKKPLKQYREAYGHTPEPVAEKILWKCKRLVIGSHLSCGF